jgi:hypothetical protein
MRRLGAPVIVLVEAYEYLGIGLVSYPLKGWIQ